MSKQKRAKTSSVFGGSKSSSQIIRLIDQAESLVLSGQIDQALAILEPLAVQYPRNGDVHNYLAYAFSAHGDLWSAAHHYQLALQINRNNGILLPLGFVYLDLHLRALASSALKQALKENLPQEIIEKIHEVLPIIESDIINVAALLQRPLKTVEEGLRYMELAQVDLHNFNYSRCIEYNRRSIKLLANYPAPHNNLSLALFFEGQWQEAIQVAGNVLIIDPENVQALGNIVRYLKWTGQEAEAQQYWEKLRNMQTDHPDLKRKIIETAAIMDDDQVVYDFGRTINWNLPGFEHFDLRDQIHLAIAEFNLGKKTAQQTVNTLNKLGVIDNPLTEALKQGKKGLGWADKVSYYNAFELMPRDKLEQFTVLMGRYEENPSPKIRRELDTFVARYPQLVLIGKKLILEHEMSELGIPMLAAIATPAAYMVLREFGTGQAGDESDRMQALQILREAGQIGKDEPVRFWQKDKWTDVVIRQLKIVDDGERDYSQQVADMLNQGFELTQAGKLDAAEKLYLRIIKLEPRAKEAYNNLGTIYVRRDDHERAKEMFRKAVEIDPMYVLACCNLAMYSLEEENADAADAILAPLDELEEINPQAMTFLSYIRAKIALLREQDEEARNHLKIALEISPDHGPSKELLERLEVLTMMKSNFRNWQERAGSRQKTARARLRKQITTPDPTVAEVLSIYTKDALTGMRYAIQPEGGLSALKKADLARALAERLQDSYHIHKVVKRLEPEDREALFMVLDHGGVIEWNEFDKKFGNDDEDSPYWNYHEPKTVMGRLRIRGLLVETTVNGQLLLAIPTEIRALLEEMKEETP